MPRIDFTTDETRRLHEQLARVYPTPNKVRLLLQRTKIAPSRYPDEDTSSASWQTLLVNLQASDDLEQLLTAVLADPETRDVHDIVRAFRDGQTPTVGFGVSTASPEASVQLLCRTLHRHLGDDSPAISRKLVDRLTGANKVSGTELFDVTRFAIEYHLLTAEALTPTLLLDVAHGRREDSLEDFRRLLRDGLRAKALRQIVVKVDPHSFFARTLGRQEDWKIYFDAVRDMSDADTAIGSTLCRIRTNGFVASQFLVAGLLPRFEDDWRPIITEYEHQIEGDHSAFVSFQASLWNTWLMWGPSIPICRCREWEGICAFQYGYGDENNSMPIIGVKDGAPISLESVARAYDPKDPGVGAVLRRMTGRLRWAPWLFRRSTADGSPAEFGDLSGELPLDALRTSPAARAQRSIYEKDRQGNERDALLFQVEEVKEGRPAEQSYFSAYLWLMFLVARRAAGPGQAARRLTDSYPAFTARAVDRRARRLWRELLPVYVHANIADSKALAMHRRMLINNAISLLREIWSERTSLFPDIDGAELCFCLVGGSDYSGCGSPIRFSSSDPLLERLRARLAEEPDRQFAASILVPHGDESAAARPPELAVFYSTCHLPDLVADYYSYVEELKGD